MGNGGEGRNEKSASLARCDRARENSLCEPHTPSAKPSNAVSELEGSRKPQQTSRCFCSPAPSPVLARTRPPFCTAQRTSNRPASPELHVASSNVVQPGPCSVLYSSHPRWTPITRSFIGVPQAQCASRFSLSACRVRSFVNRRCCWPAPWTFPGLPPGLEHHGDFAYEYHHILFVDRYDACTSFSMRLDIRFLTRDTTTIHRSSREALARRAEAEILPPRLHPLQLHVLSYPLRL
jgi:hypothetical protein